MLSPLRPLRRVSGNEKATVTLLLSQLRISAGHISRQDAADLKLPDECPAVSELLHSIVANKQQSSLWRQEVSQLGAEKICLKTLPAFRGYPVSENKFPSEERCRNRKWCVIKS